MTLVTRTAITGLKIGLQFTSKLRNRTNTEARGQPRISDDILQFESRNSPYPVDLGSRKYSGYRTRIIGPKFVSNFGISQDSIKDILIHDIQAPMISWTISVVPTQPSVSALAQKAKDGHILVMLSRISVISSSLPAQEYMQDFWRFFTQQFHMLGH